MDRKKLEDQIRKTGFVLENQTAQILRRAKWTVISNKYYIDDLEGDVREIDIIAYKVQRIFQLNIYTALLISCKKTEENIWAFLARDINSSDPNIDWWPLHYWTNDKALNYKLRKREAAQNYHNGVASLGVQEAVKQPPVDVFAFQQMNKNNGKPQNDKPIFLSITSLMKAQAYELERLPIRQEKVCIYQFNLLSVIDTELAVLMFNDNCISCTEVDSVHYIARYIVKKRETFSRIRFIRSNIFVHALEDYGRLHEANVIYFRQLRNEFYKDILEDNNRRKILSEDFKKEIALYLCFRIYHFLERRLEIENVHFSWHKDEQYVAIIIDGFDHKIVEVIKNDPKSQEIVKSALANVYHYEGDFTFEVDPWTEWDPPF